MSNSYQQPFAPRPLHRMKRVWAGGFLLLLIGSGCGAMRSDDAAKPAAKPAPAATVTATATATVTATPAAAPAPAPTVTATETVTATATVTRQASANDDPGSGGDSGADVSYSNCTEARAAGAAPVRRGEPGYGRHLDRDNDGVGCDNG
ncbi:excalibur calcium-binding domain-containing protein [Streptomyces sp. NPDC006368]|uniref:excalibur calcium-binding domain-containing protein n=1 Tax=Streptomyces sp. NPDC006368 TaxID=3156760 RepID=UPI0033A35C81